MAGFMKYGFVVFAMVAGSISVGQSVGNAREAGAKASARPKAVKARRVAPPMAVPAGVTLNACGCYRTEAGVCFCGDRNGACVCLGDCEPMACELRRAKEIEREVAVETKKAQDEEKRQRDEAAAAEAAAASHADPAPQSGEDALTDDSDDSSAEKKAGEAKTQKHASASRKRPAAKP